MNAFAPRRASPQFCSPKLVRLIGILWVLAAGLLGMAGCQSARLGRIPPAYREYHEAGVAVIGPTYEFDATTTIRSTRPVLLTLKSNQARKYQGREVYPDFRAYARPGQGGEIDVKFSEPVVEVRSGWAVLVGASPMGKTRRVRAVGQGTTMIIEIDETVSPAMHRVYLVADEHCVAHIHAPPTDPALPEDLTFGTYGEIKDVDGATWTFMGDYTANSDRAAFVKSVLEESRPIVGGTGW